MNLADVFAAGVQSAQGKASELLRQPVRLSLRSARQGGWESVADLGGLNLILRADYGQDVNGAGVVLMDARYGALIAELMFENVPPDLPSELSELQMTAAAEALSQMVGALGDGVGRATNRNVQIVGGDPTPVNGNAAAMARGQVRDDRIVVVDCEFTIGAYPPSRLVHIAAGSVGDALQADRPGGAAAAPPGLQLGPAQTAGPGGQVVQKAEFGSFGMPGGGAEAGVGGNLDLLLDVPLEITVELGRATRRMRDVLGLGPGSILELSKLAGESVDLLVNGKPIAKGEVVVIDENFAVRIVEILSREERIPGGL